MRKHTKSDSAYRVDMLRVSVSLSPSGTTQIRADAIGYSETVNSQDGTAIADAVTYATTQLNIKMAAYNFLKTTDDIDRFLHDN